MRHSRKYLLCLAIVLYKSMSWYDIGFPISYLYRMRKKELFDFVSDVCTLQHKDMWPGDYIEWEKEVKEMALKRLHGKSGGDQV